MKSQTKRFVFLALLITALLSACSLGSSNTGPATLVPQPRLTDEQLPTLGYNTPVPGESQVSSDVPTAAAPVGAYLYNRLNQVDATRLMNHVYTFESFFTRHVNSLVSDTQGNAAAANYIQGEFEKIQEQSRGNFITFTHPFTAFTEFDGQSFQAPQKNIVGIINGTEPNTPAIVIGAHYDSRTDNLSDSTGYAPGADDNGSGSAALIELARVLSQERPRTTMIFVAFSAEEVNRQGSIAFYNDYIKAFNIPVQLMINIDTVGSVNDSRGNINDSQIRVFSAGPDDNSRSRQMARMIDFISDNHNTDLEIIMEDSIDREGRYGDHLTFSNADIPSVRFIEALEDTVNREGRDTSDKVEPEYLRKSTRTLLTIIMALSNGLKAPQNPVVREMPDGMRRLAWDPVEGAKGYVVALRFNNERTFEQVFYADENSTRFECSCFDSAIYSGLAVAAINDDGMMGPLSTEITLP